MRESKSLWLSLVVLFLLGCQTPDDGVGQGVGYSYFPLEAGRYAEYEVNELHYVITSSTPRATTYYLKEVCGQPYTGTTGIVQFPIERYKRGTPQANWVLDSVWTAYLLPDRAVRVENNTAFVKLAFPLTERSTWNGNLLNSHSTEEYVVRFGVPFPAQPDFPGSLTVVQQRDSSLVSLYKRREVYAPDAGLVFKEDIAWEYCQEPACIGSGKIDTGTSRVMKIINQGKN